MATPLSDIMLDAKDLADLLNNPIVADPTWRRWANQGTERLYRLLRPLAPERFHKSASFTLTGVGGNTVALAADFRTLRASGVTKDPTNQAARRTLRRFDFGERDAQGQTPAWFRESGFDIQGDNIVVEPAASSAGNYAYYYVAGPVKWATNGTQDATAIAAVYEPYVDFIAHWMAILGAGKEESGTGDLRANLQGIVDDIMAEFAPTSDPAVIQDVEATGGSSWLP
jgi:hypothetical protein